MGPKGGIFDRRLNTPFTPGSTAPDLVLSRICEFAQHAHCETLRSCCAPGRSPHPETTPERLRARVRAFSHFSAPQPHAYPSRLSEGIFWTLRAEPQPTQGPF